MSILAPPDTIQALGGNQVPKCTSRSLYKDRFADPTAEKENEKAWYSNLRKLQAESPPEANWRPSNAVSIYGRLMSRLLVDLAGGVMENANVRLNRYGIPTIPGSAVKGCARRMALQALHDWVESQENKGSDEKPDGEDICGPCCAPFETPSDMLAAIARTFGWIGDDWRTTRKNGAYKSDFAWAVGGDQEILQNARSLLFKSEAFGGTIAFLEATPNHDPQLELDVVTPHHTKYHQEEQGYEDAPDIEDPVPVYFPAVRPQNPSDYFIFTLVPLRLAQPGDIACARSWLTLGLHLFGIGAKTNAGYGWFDTSDSFQDEVSRRLRHAAQAKFEQEKWELENKRKEAEQQQKRLAREAKEEATKNMSPVEKADWEVAQLTEPQFEAKLRNFFKSQKQGGPSDAEKEAIVRALKGPRIEAWQKLKISAQKGPLARAATEIHALNKKLHGDKMP